MKKCSKLKKVSVGIILFFGATIWGGWWFENWRGEQLWKDAKARAVSMGVPLKRKDWRLNIPEDEDLLKDPLFYEEVFVREGEDKLKSWSKLPEVDDRSKERIQPSTGETVRYRDWFKDDLTEEEAIHKVAEAAQDESKRLDKLAKLILGKPIHPIFRNEAVSLELQYGETGVGELIEIVESYRSAAIVALRQGESRRALQFFSVIHRLAEITVDPTLYHYIVAANFYNMGRGVIWEGIRLHAWEKDALRTLNQIISKYNMREVLKKSFQFELAYSLDGLELIREIYRNGEVGRWLGHDVDGLHGWIAYGGPAGWQLQRQAFVVNQNLNLIERLDGDEPLDFRRMRTEIDEVGSFSPVREIASAFEMSSLVVPSLYQAHETKRRIARIAIALEQYYQETGAYPADLSELKISFPIEDLTDPERRNLVYKLGKDGRPEIFSIHGANLSGMEQNDLKWRFCNSES